LDGAFEFVVAKDLNRHKGLAPNQILEMAGAGLVGIEGRGTPLKKALHRI
jgi:hypothetical protein